MSAREALIVQVIAHLDQRADLDPLTVFDMPPMRAALPYALIEEPVLSDWSAVGLTGFEGRLSVTVHDAGERPTRARFLAGRVEAAMDSLPVALLEGWRLATLRLMRSRVARTPPVGGAERWRATSDWVVRMYRMDA